MHMFTKLRGPTELSLDVFYVIFMHPIKSDYTTNLKKNIRKCRKKLRQIQSLEVLNRLLTHEECEKVSRKKDLLAELEFLIQEYESNTVNDDQVNTDLNTETFFPQSEDMKRSRSPSIESTEAAQNAENELIQFDDDQATPSKVVRSDPPAPSAPSVQSIQQVEEPGTSASQSVTSNSVQSTSKPKKSDKVKKQWKNASFTVDQLDGHNDLILAVDCDDDYIVSTSRDTTAKVWSLIDGKEVNSLRGHTGAVTCVKLLSQADSEGYLHDLPINSTAKQQRLIITGSTDCSVRIWSLSTGKELKSIYTYNSVNTLVYIANIRCVMTGTDGGKLELWDALSGYNHHSLLCAHEQIKCLTVKEDKIYSGTSDCILKVHKIEDYRISTLFDTELEFLNTPHVLRDLCIYNQLIYCADDHPNLKVVSWKSGKAEVLKLRNVKSGYGTSDAVHITDNLLLSSSYDLDTGKTVINVRSLPSAEYKFTLRLNEEDLGRILSISAVSRQNDTLKIISAGHSLCIWDLLSDKAKSSVDDELISAVSFDKELTKLAVDSDVDSELEDNAEDDDDEDGSESSDDDCEVEESRVNYESNSRPWYDSWCSVL